MSRACVYALTFGLLGGAAGCASDGAARREITDLRRQVDQLRHQSNRDRATLRDLENRILLMEDRVETAEVTRERRPDRTVRLPVERRSPSGEPEASLKPDGPSPAAPQGALGGLEESTVEIVYEGDAARSAGNAPTLRLHESDRRDRMVPVAARRGPPVRRDGADDIDPDAVRERIPVVPLPDAGVATTDDPLGIYRAALEALKRKEHEAAVRGFARFLSRWPDHDYADNSQYWLAEAYYDQRQYETALGEFRKVVKRYPGGNKAPDALLKIGYCYARLGDPVAAKDVLAQVIEIYPKTNSAKLAARRLEEMREP